MKKTGTKIWFLGGAVHRGVWDVSGGRHWDKDGGRWTLLEGIVGAGIVMSKTYSKSYKPWYLICGENELKST